PVHALATPAHWRTPHSHLPAAVKDRSHRILFHPTQIGSGKTSLQTVNREKPSNCKKLLQSPGKIQKVSIG
ncbi:hypothetical protein M758_UG218600, partial [Ceratodon purpureus]